MENITLGDFSAALALIAGIIASCGVIYGFLAKFMKKNLTESLRPIEKKIDNLSAKVSSVDVDNTKNFLVEFLSKFDCVGEHCPVITDEELQRFWEQYDHYTKDLGMNSYIHEKVDRLKKQGKL